MLLIQGAGIAGLTLAGLLERQGIDYLIIDRCAVLQTVGAGIVLQRNALAVLSLFEAGDLAGTSRELAAMSIGSPRQPLLQLIELDRNTRARGIHRAQLQTFLLQQISADRLRLGCSVSCWEPRADGLNVTLDNGEHLQCAALIGADGIDSSIRRQLSGATRIRSTAQWCARTIICGQPGGDRAMEIHAGRSRLGVVPLAGNDSYVYWVRSSHAGGAIDVADIHSDIGRLGSLGGAVLAHLRPNQAWLQHPLTDIPISWGEGPIALIGDAAHALTPNLGQGAALGIEDAYILAGLIQTADGNTLAERLAATRHARIARIRRASFAAGRVAHVRNPLARLCRDLALRWVPGPVVARGLDRWLAEFAEEPERRLHAIESSPGLAASF